MTTTFLQCYCHCGGRSSALDDRCRDRKTVRVEKRPDYEHHLGDPLQLFYDRGYVVHDPFDGANPDQTWYISIEVCNTCNTCISCITCVRCSIAFPHVEGGAY